MKRAVLLLLALLLPATPGQASVRGEVLPGPVMGRVTGVIDGDTLSVRLRVWIGQEIETSVRLAGIDAPELRGKCEREKRLARAARAELARMLESGAVTLTNIRLEKYAGRVLAEVKGPDGADPAQRLLDLGLARPYGGEKRKSWCG